MQLNKGSNKINTVTLLYLKELERGAQKIFTWMSDSMYPVSRIPNMDFRDIVDMHRVDHKKKLMTRNTYDACSCIEQHAAGTELLASGTRRVGTEQYERQGTGLKFSDEGWEGIVTYHARS